jgi:hypothetical protein
MHGVSLLVIVINKLCVTVYYTGLIVERVPIWREMQDNAINYVDLATSLYGWLGIFHLWSKRRQPLSTLDS